VQDVECSKLASEFFDRVCRDEGITSDAAAVLHSDNGAPMRSFKLAAKMRELGISLSFSRPGVSNDNAYAESLFRTMKYHQSYPPDCPTHLNRDAHATASGSGSRR
jgi:putative transposase